MSDIPVKIKKGLKATMPSQIEEGTIYVTTDTGVMYADVSSNERIRICDETAVSYMSQSLSEAQKSQARANIGAGKPQVHSDLSQTNETAPDYVKGIIRQESLPEGYPYEEVTENVYFNTTASELDNGNVGDASWLEAGKTYIVQFGDEVFEITAEAGTNMDLFGGGYVYLGCKVGTSGAYGDYPFSIYRPDNNVANGQYVLKETPAQPTIIKVSIAETTIHPMDEKFLPDSTKDTVRYVKQTLTDEQKVRARANIEAQEKLTGDPDQIITFDENGNTIVQDTANSEDAIITLSELGFVSPAQQDGVIYTDPDGKVLII